MPTGIYDGTGSYGTQYGNYLTNALLACHCCDPSATCRQRKRSGQRLIQQKWYHVRLSLSLSLSLCMSVCLPVTADQLWPHCNHFVIFCKALDLILFELGLRATYYIGLKIGKCRTYSLSFSAFNPGPFTLTLPPIFVELKPIAWSRELNKPRRVTLEAYRPSLRRSLHSEIIIEYN